MVSVDKKCSKPVELPEVKERTVTKCEPDGQARLAIGHVGYEDEVAKHESLPSEPSSVYRDQPAGQTGAACRLSKSDSSTQTAAAKKHDFMNL